MSSAATMVHPGGVKLRIVVVAIGLLMIGSLSMAAFAVADGRKSPAVHAHAKAHPGQHAGDSGKGSKAEDAKGDGPPPWARAHHGKPDAAWKKAWKALTPAQRAARMAELAQQHADGMKLFAACVKAAGDDSSARAKCVRPLPPGQAKKQLAN